MKILMLSLSKHEPAGGLKRALQRAQADRQAAADVEHLSRGEARVLGQEVGDGGGDLARLADALQRHAVEDRLGARVVRRVAPAEQLGLDRSGRHAVDGDVVLGELQRSEEHTYELQSLMRLSYAVFG